MLDALGKPIRHITHISLTQSENFANTYTYIEWKTLSFLYQHEKRVSVEVKKCYKQ